MLTKKTIPRRQQQQKDNEQERIAPADEERRNLADDVAHFLAAQFDSILLIGSLFFHFFVIHLFGLCRHSISKTEKDQEPSSNWFRTKW